VLLCPVERVFANSCATPARSGRMPRPSRGDQGTASRVSPRGHAPRACVIYRGFETSNIIHRRLPASDVRPRRNLPVHRPSTVPSWLVVMCGSFRPSSSRRKSHRATLAVNRAHTAAEQDRARPAARVTMPYWLNSRLSTAPNVISAPPANQRPPGRFRQRRSESPVFS